MEKYGMGDVRQSRKKWDAAENQPLFAVEELRRLSVFPHLQTLTYPAQ